MEPARTSLSIDAGHEIYSREALEPRVLSCSHEMMFAAANLQMEVDNDDRHNNDSAFSAWLYSLSARIYRGISMYFGWHGRFVSRYPWPTIILSLLLSFILTFFYFHINARENDGKQLFTPDNAQAFKDKDFYESIYGAPPSQTRILVTRRVDLNKEEDCESRSLMSDDDEARHNLLEVLAFFEEINQFTVDHKGKAYTLNDLCDKPLAAGPCRVTSILDAWNYSASVVQQDPSPNLTVQEPFTDSFGVPLNASYLLGFNSALCPHNVEAFQIFVIMRYEAEKVKGGSYDPKLRKWNERLSKTLKAKNQNGNLLFYANNLDAINRESEETLRKDQKLLWVAYLIVIIYCHIALFKNSYSKCKAHLAIVTCLSVIMAIYSSYGIAQIFGVKFNPVHRALPFLLMGLGVDDTFVIMSAYQKTSVTLEVSERIRQTSMHAGSAILVTSVTDFVAFLTGVFTSLKALRDFSLYAALGILMDFFYQVTFFLAFLVLEAQRERRNHERLETESSNHKLNSLTRYSGDVDLFNDAIISLLQNQETRNERHETQPTTQEITLTTGVLDNDQSIQEKKLLGFGYYYPRSNFTALIAGKWLPKIALHPIGKIAVSAIELILLSFAIVGCTKAKMDFRFEDWFVRDGSLLQKAVNLERQYFGGNQIPFHAVTKELKREDHFHNQKQLLIFGNGLRADPYAAPNPPIVSWFEDFILYAQSIESGPKLQDSLFVDPDEFLFYLQEFLKGPGRFYSNSIIFDEKGERLIAARVSGFTKDIQSGNFAIHTVDSLRETAKNTAPNLHPVVYSYGFLYYDGYRVIAWETVRNIMLAGTAVFLVTLVIIANFPTCILVLLMVALTDVMLLGSMWYLNLTFNSVTCICMVLAVGIAVDYAVHIAHAFLGVSGTRQQRAEKALNKIGGAVLNGAFTTFLAVCVLGFAQHYILKTFFKMLLGIVVWGAWHGIVVLPVLLSFIGPKAYFFHEINA